MRFRIIKTGNEEIKLQRRFLFWWFTEKEFLTVDKTFKNNTQAFDYATEKYGPKTPPTVVHKFKL